MEWEITTADVMIVLSAHNMLRIPASKIEEYHGLLDHDSITENCLSHVMMEDQTTQMMSDIENQLMEEGVIKGKKKFYAP